MSLKNQLKIQVFLMFAIWGSWLTTLGSYMIVTLQLEGAAVGAVFSTLGVGALTMPAIMGILADKWVSAKKLYMFCHTGCAVTLLLATQASSGTAMFWVILFNCLTFMPSMALYNSMAYYRLQQVGLNVVDTFPPIRVWGTVGFIVAMLGVSLAGWELSANQLYVGATLSVVSVLFTAFLPHIPVFNTGESKSFAARLGLDALSLFKDPKMAVFFIFSMLLGILLQVTNIFGNTFIHSFDAVAEFKGSYLVEHASLVLSLSQMSETLCILMIPFFLRRYGIKTVMMISMFAWFLRYGLFAYGDPSAFGTLLLVLSMLVYGVAFDFFNVSGSVYVDKEAPPSNRASAQGLFQMMVNGIGNICGGLLSGYVVQKYTTAGVTQWHDVWVFFAACALGLFIVFPFVFRYKHKG
ncbi:nucleoside permease [Klebsiella sp. PL-2018]|uniref:nucleoside permease n=1 Tax=Klebsiella TaxID=570 RepID=UPI001C2135FC|nr:nucleoside permease [Klebsiella sp. PL-2018]QXD00961.1 Nucleoside permease NupG [Klebsiella sp. PL-2018]